MSMWQHVMPRLETQERDYDTGDHVAWWNDDYQRMSFIDVASAPERNTLVRLYVSTFREEVTIKLTCSQAVELRRLLQQAIDSIPEQAPE